MMDSEAVPGQSSTENSISGSLAINRKQIEHIFSHCGDMYILHWSYGPELAYNAMSVYFISLIQDKKMNYLKQSLQDMVAHEVGPAETLTPDDIIRFYSQKGVSSRASVLLDCFDDAIRYILNGNVVIFIDGWNRALGYKAFGLELRHVSEPVSEPVVIGPREGTVENLQVNIGLLRNRLKSPRLKIEMLKAGGETQTEVAFGYLEGTVNEDSLAEFKKRISGIHTIDVLETSFIESLIEDSMYSPFPQSRYTERPDVAVAALLNGKIAVMVEGTGSILICPGLFVELMQSNDDYYQRSVFASMIRILRVVAFFISLSLPSIYIALSTFHPELIPTVLLLAVIDTREGIPFSAFFEALLMSFLFELLREAGLRLPRPIGSAVSIVGALVIGEAAIDAGIASPIMVVVVALTGIASFSIPQYNFAISLRILQFFLMVCAAFLGGFGLMIGFLLILLHLCSLRSLGQPYLAPLAPLRPNKFIDVFIRAPIRTLFRSTREKRLSKSGR